MDTTQPWYASKTIWAALITLLSIVFGLFKIQIDPATQQLLIDQSSALAIAVGAFVGTAGAIYGRVVATKKIG